MLSCDHFLSRKFNLGPLLLVASLVQYLEVKGVIISSQRTAALKDKFPPKLKIQSLSTQPHGADGKL